VFYTIFQSFTLPGSLKI